MDNPEQRRYHTGKNLSVFFTEGQPIDDEMLSAAFRDAEQAFEQELSPLEEAIHALNNETGFNTTEIQEANQAIVVGLNDPNVDASAMRQAWAELARIVETKVHSNSEVNFVAKIHIAEILNKAFIFQQGNRPHKYLEELDLAELYARNFGLDELSRMLDAEINSRIESLEMNPTLLVVSLRGAVSEINREFMRDLIADGDDMEDIITHAYNAIREEGGDPEETLSKIKSPKNHQD